MFREGFGKRKDESDGEKGREGKETCWQSLTDQDEELVESEKNKLAVAPEE